jgi:hypothetical protein
MIFIKIYLLLFLDLLFINIYLFFGQSTGGKELTTAKDNISQSC